MNKIIYESLGIEILNFIETFTNYRPVICKNEDCAYRMKDEEICLLREVKISVTGKCSNFKKK